MLEAMLAAGIVTPPDTIHMDGQLHRFRSGTKGKPGEDRSGWYVLFPDGVPAGRFGCWRAGIEQTFRAETGRELSVADEMAISRRLAEAQRARDAERKRKAETASSVVSTIWSHAGIADDSHPYLIRKGIGASGARVTGDGRLVVPLYAPDGTLSSVQYIDADGDKLYHSGGVTKGCFWWIGSGDEHRTVYLAEGFATAASIHAATGARCYVAYSAHNLVPVCETIRKQHANVVIVADADASGIGESKANEAASKYGARVVIPPVPGDANDYAQAGGDLSELLDPKIDDWLIPADKFASEQAPVNWYVKRWIQRDALVMVHGPSGSGKTFVVLDMVLRIASGMTQWQQQTVKPGKVVYLAGEGHHGMKGRIAAWKQHHGKKSLGMWVSKAGCDLNTPAGLQRVRESIRSLGEKVDVIVVDTLHRFLAGDENSAQDAKTMLDACAELMKEFHCTVILVHHTGVSDEAQHRARGSSAWRGALDIEISVVPPRREGESISIVQRKSKDSETADPVFVDLEPVTIADWEDEDGGPVKSAVLVGGAKPIKPEKSAMMKAKKQIREAWQRAGCEMHDGKPYVSRQAIIDYLMNATTDKSGNKLSQAAARKAIAPGDKGRMVGALLCESRIEQAKEGYIIVCSDILESINLGMGQ